MSDTASHPPKRSAGALKHRRVPLSWPKDRDFRILSIDGGGIRGIFPATVLAGLEERYLGGASVAAYFDLIAGTSTGGILALGLAAGLTAAQLNELYLERGGEIFPPLPGGPAGWVRRKWRDIQHFYRYRYDREALERILTEKLRDRVLGDATTRLCIPAFEGRFSEVYIFKTPHHPDFQMDWKERMVKVALATAAAPTFYRPLEDNGYTFVDGGVWANNPTMIALVDALSAFDVAREQIRILSLGCGDDPYIVEGKKITLGGIWYWKEIIYAAMRLQSLNAIGQASLLTGADRLIRIDAPTNEHKIALDDWLRARADLPPAAMQALADRGAEIAEKFLSIRAEPYTPIYGSRASTTRG
jgi:patatin-like phospholipase/acyl hydrolase